MQVNEVISKAELFINNFINKLSDETEQPAKKQVYFLDSQEELQKYKNALQKIVTNYSENENNDEEEIALLDRANAIISKLKDALKDYQKQLVIDSNITEEDTVVSLTEQSISNAMENNKTTQEISTNLQAISEQKAMPKMVYNYALVCDEQINLLEAYNDQDLNKLINAFVNAGDYKDIALYKLTSSPVPLKKKTILSI